MFPDTTSRMERMRQRGLPEKFRAKGKSYRWIAMSVSLAFSCSYSAPTVYRWFETGQQYKKRLEYNAAWKRRKRRKD